MLNHAESRLDLYFYQALMSDEWEKHKAFLRVIGTGSGPNALARRCEIDSD